jgi:hypothetical protein
MHPDTSIKQDFEREWASFHANRRPLGWMLRSDQSLAWVRFHSLPNSKRYPESDAEKDIILSRAYSLANETLGADVSCWQIECRKEEVNHYIGSNYVIVYKFGSDAILLKRNGFRTPSNQARSGSSFALPLI